MKKYLLEIAVFLCGAIVMIYEIVGSRVVAPHFGTSIYVWTSLIGVILASLSTGYWLGGRLADKKPTYKQLSQIIFAASIFIIVSVVFKDMILNFLSGNLKGMMMRSLLAAILLFAPASIFLGMVSPYAVRLKLTDIKSSGKIVGNLYAISTVGSIVGTFLAGFFLIPLLGTANIMYIISGILILLAISINFRFLRKAEGIFFILVLIAAIFQIYDSNNRKGNILETDTQYNHVQIFDMDYWVNGKNIKVMKVNDEYSSAMFHDNDSLVYEYLQFYQLAEHFCPGFSKGLIFGGAAYSFPRFYLQKYRSATLDVVEIDPGLTDLARKHFRLTDDPRMRIFHEDGRTFINKQTSKYDVIYGDAYKSLLAIPFQLTTLEAITKKYEMLNEGGIIIENIIASLEGPPSRFMKAEFNTYSKVFPQVYLFACHDPENKELLQSISLIAIKSEIEPEFISEDPLLNTFLKHKIIPMLPDDVMTLTDDYAPVEYFAMKAM